MSKLNQLSSLLAVNSEVNAAISYTSDQQQFSRPDWWQDALLACPTSGYGDCEDYTLAKLHRLQHLGFSADSLKIGLCWTEVGDYHCVLIATMDGEDYVLDNRYVDIQRWEELPYRWDCLYLVGKKRWYTITSNTTTEGA